MNIKKKRTRKIKELLSPVQLQYWLEGILEFQSDDWAPTGDQWKLIKDKINSLDTSLVPPETNMIQYIPTPLPITGQTNSSIYGTGMISASPGTVREDIPIIPSGSIGVPFDDQLADTPLDTTELENMKPIGDPLIGSQLKSGIIDVQITDACGSRSSFA